LRIDPTKRHHPVPLQLGASDNPFLEPRARHCVYPWLSTRARPVTQSLDAVLFIAVMPFVGRRPAQPSQPRRFLMLPSPRACSRSSELAGRPARSRVVPNAAALPLAVRCERNMPASSIPQTWYARPLALPHLGITGSPYKPVRLCYAWCRVRGSNLRPSVYKLWRRRRSAHL
jgi:hypothetical protein